MQPLFTALSRPLAALLLLAVLLSGTVVRANPASVAQAPPLVPGGNFGAPPSGEYPILYNDHTVYAKPDILKRQRVLAALIKNGQIFVPLRSMFEQMGATVTVSADGKTTTATKPGTTVSVSLGSSVVVINGESRPLDVPPMLYQGIVLVPVRVISEALGAYVLWVADRRLVVVRYIPATPPPPPAPTAAPTVAPPVPTPAPTLAPETYRAFVQAAYAWGKNYNEFTAGKCCCPPTFVVAGAYVFKDSPLALKVDYRQDTYVTSDNLTDQFNNHYTRFATIDGGFALTPVFKARQSTVDARVLYQVAAPRVYVGLGYLRTSDNYGYPHLSGLGAGIEKLPELQSGLSFSASAFYYPNASGNYTVNNAASPNNGKTYKQSYDILKYDAALSLAFAHSPIYIYGGFSGDRYTAKQNAPIGQTHGGPYIGLGVKI